MKTKHISVQRRKNFEYFFNTYLLQKQYEQNTNEVIKNVNEFSYRSHNCGELREPDIGKEVTLCGWLEFSRMNKFFTLRDGYGHTQVIIPNKVRTLSVIKINQLHILSQLLHN